MSGTLARDARVRVRTPGKHIVMFLLAALLIVFGAMSVLRHVDHAPPGLSFAAVGDRARTVTPGDARALEPFLVDLAPDRNGRVAYLRLAAGLRLQPGARAEERVTALEGEIADRLNTLFRGLTPEDFAGDEGMARVRAEMLRRVNLVIAPVRAEEVVITEIIIQ